MSDKTLTVKSDFQIEKPGLESEVVKASVGIEIESESGDLYDVSERVSATLSAANKGFDNSDIAHKAVTPAEPVLDFRTDFENAPDIERVLFLVREECGLSQVRDGYVSKETELIMFFLEGLLEAKRVHHSNVLGWCPKPKITIDGEER
jgi:hypothetical protein